MGGFFFTQNICLQRTGGQTQYIYIHKISNHSLKVKDGDLYMAVGLNRPLVCQAPLDLTWPEKLPAGRDGCGLGADLQQAAKEPSR